MSDLANAVVVLILTATLVIGGAAYGVVDVRARRACLERGFPEHKIALPLTPYCIKRVNQTDSVVALAKLR